MKQVVTVVVIGYGGMGSRHAKQMRLVEGICVKGAFDILPEKQRQMTEEGFCAYSSYEAVLQDHEVDMVVIATPNQFHKPQSIAAMQAGKHVVCEKPVALDTGELEEILQVQKETGKRFIVHQNRRWDEDYTTVRKVYDNGKIGEVFHIESRVMGSRGVPNDWRRMKECGGGMLFDWGVHLIDQILCMVPGKLMKIFCRLSYQLGLNVDDGFLLFLQFEGEKTVLLQAATWNFESMPRWYMNGMKGTVKIDRWHQNGVVTCLKKEIVGDAVPVVTAAGITKTMAPREDDSLMTETLELLPGTPFAFYENVRDTLFGICEPIVRTEQVMRCLKVIEAARVSSELGEAVMFEK